MPRNKDKRIIITVVTRVHWFRHDSINTNVVLESSQKNLYSTVKYQYDIFSVIHNFVNLYLMCNKTSKTSKLLWCSVATGSIKKKMFKYNIQQKN